MILFRILSLAVLLLLSVQMLLGQTVNADGQQHRIADTLQLELLDSLVRKVYWTKQPDSAFYHAEQMLDLSSQMKEDKYANKALKQKAELLKKLGDYSSAIPVNAARIAVCETGDYDETTRYQDLADAHKNMAYALRKVGQIKSSLEHYQHSIHYAEAIGAEGEQKLANTLNSLGSLYLNIREYDQAKEKYEQSLKIYQRIEYTKGIYSVLNNLGLVHAKNGDYNSAIAYYERSLEMKKKAGDKKRMANTYGSIGDIYLVWGKEVEARQYFLQAKGLQEELGLRDELTRSLTQLGGLALLQNKPLEALEWCGQSFTIAEKDQLWQASMACNECLYKAHKALGNTDNALLHYEAYIMVKDSVINIENSLEISQIEAQHKYEKQLAIAKKEQIILVNEAEKERLLRWLFLGSTLALAFISWLTFRNSRLRKRQNKILTNKNKQMVETHELIQRQAQQLQETASMKDRFFANVSHELRTPLTLVTSPLGKLLDEESHQLPKFVQENLKLVKGNSDKLLDLVEELLELSQLEAGAVVLDEQDLMIVPFLQQLYTNYQLFADEKDIDYRFSSTIPIDLYIKTDLKRLEKIVDNLLSNAFKYTAKQGKIQINLSQSSEQPSELILQIKDTGEGIPVDELPLLFDRYYQGSQRKENGIGIGLALAQEFAHLLGGEIKVKSTLGKGSVFTLIFPIKTAVLVETTALSATQDKRVVHKLTNKEQLSASRILIVEDNEELRRYITGLFQTYQCTSVQNGKIAMETLLKAHKNHKPFDLILTDLMMPEMDGISLLTEIRKHPALSNTRLVVLTARQNLSEKLNLLRFGVDDYLTKPFSAKELQLRIQHLLQYPITTSSPEKQDTESSNIELSWLNKVEQLIEELLHSKQELTASTLASALNVSNRQLLRKVQAATGMSTQLYLQECKLQLAKRYIDIKQYKTIQEVAVASGFNTSNYFNKLYMQRFGKRPEDLLEM